MSNEQRAAQRDFDQIQFLFFTDGSPNLYKWIKVCGDLKFGVSTQCVNAFKLDLVDKKDRLQMIQNLVKKVCERRDGLLHAINRECLNELPSKTTEAFIRYTTTENTTMFVGIFSTKSDDRIKVMTSNVGVSTLSSSFNADIECTKFWSRFEFTTNGNNINKLEELMYKTFLAFYEHNQCFPDNVFLYRGSMSESAAEEMAPDEIKAISDAWSKLVKDKQKNKTLKLLYVTVERRHKIRLIKSVVSRNSDPSKANVDKGTVVDQIITSPKGNDFYLCSHEGLKGTSKPAHYIIQYSNWDKLDPNDIQLITYCLCYLLARSVTPISVPTPVYYAQLMCKRLRDYMGVIEWKDVKVHPRLINKNFIT
ncbi:hypothetical protein M3Y94_00381500 [Aphelenchoides besseyi]|nr:hypothetical protein M3Y94_00381500 [Aphelenchoides besseyi]